MKRVLVGGLSVLIASAAIVVAYYANEIRLARQSTQALVSAAFIEHGKELDLNSLSSERKEMLLKVEDPTFYRHKGVDLQSPGAGMTTVTQGLVKLLYFPNGFKQGIAKVRQTLIALYALDEIVSKDEQLVLFLNISYLGDVEGKSVYGFANASRAYFKKEFSTLSDDEYLALVSMLISPNTLKPHSEAAIQRLARVKAYLAGQIQPQSLLDVEYEGKQNGTAAEVLLMVALRCITDWDPSSNN